MLTKKHHGKRGLFLLLTFLFLVLTSQVFTQAPPDASTMPEGIKGERIKAFISAVNADDPDQVREFFDKNCTEKFKNLVPMDQHITVFRVLYHGTGGIEFQGIDSQAPEPEKVTPVIFKGRIKRTWRVSFFWSNEGLIDVLMMQEEKPSDTDPGPALTEEQFLQKIKELMTKLIENDMFSGTLLVARGEKVLFTLAGGGFSTVNDLHHFALVITAGKLVSQESLDKMWKIHGGTNYGYGFVIENGNNGKVVGHGGGFPGINSELKIYLDKDYIVAVMANYDRAASDVALQIDSFISQVR